MNENRDGADEEEDLENYNTQAGRTLVNKIQLKTSIFVITGMTCTACSGAIEKHLGGSVDGVKEVSVSLLTNKATVKHD